MTIQKPYNAKTLEMKWQKKWNNLNLFKAKEERKKKN